MSTSDLAISTTDSTLSETHVGVIVRRRYGAHGITHHFWSRSSVAPRRRFRACSLALVLSEDAPNQRRGFTVVELLIVIVVIAILATIVLVGYPNVIRTADARAWAAAANDWTELLKADLARHGSKIPDAGVHCLGNSFENYPATAIFAEGECMKYSGGSLELPTTASSEPTIMQALP